MAGQRDHHLRQNSHAFLFGVTSGLKDRANLHLIQRRHGDTQAAAAQTQHRVELVHVLDHCQQVFFCRVALARSLQRGYFGYQFFE